MLTNFGRLQSEQMLTWSLRFWRQARDLSFINKFTGTGENSMIQQITELKKDSKGSTQAVITLLADMKSDGIAGDSQLEGNEEALSQADCIITLDQLRNANINEGRMADQNSVVQFRGASKNALAWWAVDRIDQLAFLTLSGVSYARNTDGSLRVGSQLSKLKFAADVTAPSAKRRFRWNAAEKELEDGGASNQLTAADTPSYAMLVKMRAKAKAKRIRGLKGNGGEDLYHVFLHPYAMEKLKLDPDYLANLRSGYVRSESNPLFAGGVVTVDGLVIHEYNHVYNTTGLASGAKWGANGTVEGCAVLFCGAQALAFADIGNAEWDEREFDYGNRQGIAIAKITGFLKPQFPTIYEGDTLEDFGVMVTYVAM